MKQFVRPGSRVVVKPNLLFGRRPEKAVNTHPALVAEICRLALEAGAAAVAVGDAPGYGNTVAAAKQAGYVDAVKELDVEFIEFTPLENIDQQRFFMRLELAKELLEADVVINLPKFKTHGQMLMTMAVKNCFGAVPGHRKFQWHYRAGKDKMLFARALNEIAMAVNPALTVMDAILAMDGAGPGSGRARAADFLAAGDDPWAVDAAAMDVLGIDRRLLFTLADAMEHGPHSWEKATLAGDSPNALRPDDWDLPELATAQMHGPFVERYLPGLAAWLRERISPPPYPKAECIVCGYCRSICPAGAISETADGIVIDKNLCIRCYCCHELCQHGGMAMPKGGLAARLLGIR